jgi:hypothetical protein
MIRAFELTLLADLVTLVTVVVTAIRRRSRVYGLIAAIAAGASGLALHQMISGQGNVLTLIVTGVLLAAVTFRTALERRRAPPRGKRRWQ